MMEIHIAKEEQTKHHTKNKGAVYPFRHLPAIHIEPSFICDLKVVPIGWNIVVNGRLSCLMKAKASTK